MEILTLIVSGIAIGIIGAYFGIGGGVLIVPIIAILYPDLAQQAVIACSLGIICINSLIHTANYLRQFKMSVALILQSALFSILFSVIISYNLDNLDSLVLKWVFVIFLLLVSLYMIFFKGRSNEKRENFSFKSAAIIGSCSGFISGFTGVGGGVATIPLLIRFTNIDIKKVAAYSNAIMIFTTLSAVITFSFAGEQNIELFSIGFLVPEIIIYMAIGGIIGSYAGVKLNQKLSQQQYRNSLSLLFIFLFMYTLLSLILG